MAVGADKSRRVMLAEDEAMVAMLVEGMLIDLGHQIVAIARTKQEAIEVAQTTDAEFAVLDVNLNGEYTYDVAAVLVNRGIPFLFATGYGNAGLEPGWRSTPTLQKPFQVQDLARCIEEIISPA